MSYTYTESNLVGNISAPITSTATTITGIVKDRVTGLQRDPQTTTYLWVLDKGTSTNPNNYWELIYGEPATTAGVTTWSNCVRGLAYYGTSLVAVTANKKAHTANAEIGTVDVHLLFNLLTAQLDGSATGAQTLTLHVYATEAARDAGIPSPTAGMVCMVTGTQTLYLYVNGHWYGSACPVYATTATRDTAIPSPVNGMSCYVTADGVFYDYQAGSWQDRANGATPLASTVTAGKVYIDAADAGPTVPSLSSTRILDATSQSATGQIKIANNTTGSRSATLSLHSDDTYTSGAFIVARSSAGVNALTTETHRGTGEHSIVHSENANYYLNTGTGVFKADSDIVTAATAGETLVAGNHVYLKQSDNKVYKADYTTVEKAVQYLGVVIIGGAANATVFVQYAGIYTTSALTAGQAYYLSNTGGALGGVPSFQSVSIVPMEIGIALSTTKLLIRPRRMQRVIPFNNTRTAASGSGTQTITIGGATPFLIGRVEISSALPGANFCTGSYDATTGANLYVFNGTSVANAGTSYCVAVDDAGGNWKGVGGVSTYDFTIAWTKTTAPATVYFSGLIYELI